VVVISVAVFKYLERSAAVGVLRDLFGLASGDDVGRLSELFALIAHVVELSEQLRQLDSQLSVVLLQLTAPYRLTGRRRVRGRVTTEQRLSLLAMALRLHRRPGA